MGVSQKFTLSLISQDQDSNSSVVRLKWTSTQSGSSYNNNLNTAWATIFVNGVKEETYEVTYKLPASSTTTILDKKVTVYHDAAGECTVQAVGWMDTGISAGEFDHDETLELPMIPRESSLSVSSGTLGTEQELVINRKSDSLKSRITFNCGDQSGYVNGSADFLTGDSYTWTPPLSLAAENTTGTSVSVKLSLWTYTSGGVHVGTKEYTVSYTIPTSVIPTIEQITITDTTPHSTTYGQPVQGLSRLKIQVEAKKAYGSDITEYTIETNGARYNTNTATTDVLKGSGELAVNVTVKDKRGRTGTKSKPVWALAYTPPTVTALEVHRCNEDGTDNDKGLCVKVTFSAEVTKLNGLNTAEYSLRYFQSGDPSNVTDVSFPELNNVYSVTGKTYIFAADENLSYEAEVTATDAHDSSTLSTSASTAFTMMNWHKSGTGLGIGKVSERENAAEFGVDIYDKHGDQVCGLRTLVDIFIPIGTIVLRYDFINPETIYPGTTWSQITARILRAVSATGSIGAEGDIDSGTIGGRTYVDIAVWRRTA